MPATRRSFLESSAASLLTTAGLTAMPRATRAQGSDKPIRWVYPFSPGSSAEVAVRAIAERMSGELKRPIVVDPRPGAGGIVGYTAAMRSDPDGSTIVAVSPSVHSLPLLHKSLPADFREDFVFVSQLFRYYNVFITPPDSPFRSIADLVGEAHARPGTVSVGSVQVGGIGWMMIKKLAHARNLRFNEVVYQTTSQQMVDVLGGRLAVGTALVGDAAPYIRDGRVRALGVSAPRAVPQLSGVAPIADTVPGFEMSSWFGLGVLKGTSPALIDSYERSAIASVRSSEMQERLVKGGLQAVGSSRGEFASFLSEEARLYRQVFRDANVQPG